jgi:hypothetical protein
MGAACLILLGIGLILLVVPETIRMRIIQSRYQPTPGKVIGTSINDMGGRLSIFAGFEPVIRYEYTVDGIRYLGDTYQLREFGNRTGLKEWAQDVVDHYPPGAVCHVYYNPVSPDKSTLRMPDSENSGAFLFSVLLLALIAIVAGVIGWRRLALPS